MLRATWLRIWGVLTRPEQEFPRIAEHAPFRMALVLHLVMNGLAVLMQAGDEDADTLLSWYLPVTLLLLIATLVLALLSAAVARLLRERAHFASLYCVLVFTEVPWLVTSVFDWWSRQHWLAYKTGQVLNLIVLWWTTALLYQGLRSSYRLSWWKTGLVALPGLLFSWSWTLWFVFGTPPALKATQPWQRTEGHRVIVYYPPGKSPEEIAEIVRGCDRTLGPIHRRLEVDPLPFKVEVFLFPDDRLHRRVAGRGEEDQKGTSYAHDRAISTVYAAWPIIHCTVAHELGHVVVEQQIASDLPSFLSEGIATFIQFSVARDACKIAGETPPRRTTRIPLRTLVRGAVFWDLEQATEMGGDRKSHYLHAASFVHYLIEQYGWDRMKQLCQEWARVTRPWYSGEDESTSFVRIVEKIYGLPLDQLEGRWRKER